MPLEVFIKYLEKYFILSTAHQYWGNDNVTFQFSYQGQYFDQLGFHYYIKQDEIEIKDFDFSLLEMSLERYNFIYHNHFYNLDLSTLDTIAPIPVGCSGCGIWNFGMDEPVLLGVLQEYNSSKAEIKIIKLPVITKFINKHVNKV